MPAERQLSEMPLEAAQTVPMAPGYSVVAAGDSERMMESFGYLAEALVLAIVFVHLILAAQFESFIDPLAIMRSWLVMPWQDDGVTVSRAPATA